MPIPWYFKASLGVDLAAELSVTALVGGAPRFDGTLNLSPEVKGTLGAGVDALIAVEGWVSRGVNESIRFDGGAHVAGADLTLGVGGRAYAWMFEYDFGSLEWNCDVLAGTCSGPGLDAADARSAAALAESAAPARLIPRTYLGVPGYGNFPAGAASSTGAARALDAALGAAAVDTQTAAVQQVVFPQSQAFLAAAGDQLQGAWLYDEPARSAINRSVAVFSTWQGSAWGSFAPIADDGTADFHPRLLTFGDGATAAAWEDVKGALPDTATFESMTAAMEISVGVRTAQTGQWRTWRLTDNSYLDRSPRVAGRPVGDLDCECREPGARHRRGAEPAEGGSLERGGLGCTANPGDLR